MAKTTPIPRADLKKIARARITDAECLFTGGRYDGAVYLCGYAVELALKARICRTLKWPEFDPSGPLHAFKSHSFDFLLSLSGIEAKITRLYLSPWSTMKRWEPELRYRPVGSTTRAEARNMIDAAVELLRVI
jgi:HEPN domain-containing protein